MTLARLKRLALLALLPVMLGAGQCSGGGGSDAGPTANQLATASLTVAQVGQIIAQAVAEAQARGLLATIAVTDRVGNVLGVFQMNGAAGATSTITSGRGVNSGLETIALPVEIFAITKALTGAYLSSGGNAFTSRTASQIVQENFNPGELMQPGGPLFGVQFSQLPCSDLSVRFASNSGGTINASIGPKRSPAGLAADPGGLPLYIGGVLVGGIGVEVPGTYGLDPVITDIDVNPEELIAQAGQSGFVPDQGIRANRVTVEGKSLRYVDQDSGALLSNPGAAPAFGAIDGVAGALVPVTGYHTGAALVAGVAYGTAASGFRLDGGADYAVANAMVLVDGANANRFAPRAGTDGPGALTAAEVRAIIEEALKIANAARAQIRRPLGSAAQVSVSVVDSNGVALAVARTPDAPVFGIEVSLQKARTAAFFSNANAAGDLTAGGHGNYVAAAQADIGPGALTGLSAFPDRAGGNLSRPFFPDGINGNPNGPFSRAFADWSPFSTGLQLDLVAANIVAHVGFVIAGTPDTPPFCTALPLVPLAGAPRIANGIQIFPGSVPIYRGNQLVGGIGVSGDGVDQDDLVSFLGLHNAGVRLGTGVGNAPAAIRSDNIVVRGVRLRYVNCPFQPFLDSAQTNVCEGK